MGQKGEEQKISTVCVKGKLNEGIMMFDGNILYINYSSSKDDCPFIISGGGLTTVKKKRKRK